MELSETQTRDYLSRPFKTRPECFSFPEDWLPLCTCKSAITEYCKLPGRVTPEWWKLPSATEYVGSFPSDYGFRESSIQSDVEPWRILGKLIYLSCLGKFSSGVCYLSKCVRSFRYNSSCMCMCFSGCCATLCFP